MLNRSSFHPRAIFHSKLMVTSKGTSGSVGISLVIDRKQPTTNPNCAPAVRVHAVTTGSMVDSSKYKIRLKWPEWQIHADMLGIGWMCCFLFLTENSIQLKWMTFGSTHVTWKTSVRKTLQIFGNLGPSLGDQHCEHMCKAEWIATLLILLAFSNLKQVDFQPGVADVLPHTATQRNENLSFAPVIFICFII